MTTTTTTTIFKGIHGTTKYHYESISDKGFTIFPNAKVGKAGKGIYFWHYKTNRTSAVYCAQKWCDFALKQKMYDVSKNCEIVKIDVTIETDEKKVLDFNMEVRESFDEAFPIGLYNESSYGAMLDVFLQDLEENSNVSYDLITVDLSVPGLGRNVAFSNGHPALIVKNDINIKIIECIN